MIVKVDIKMLFFTDMSEFKIKLIYFNHKILQVESNCSSNLICVKWSFI
jgi:hypothetical protein